MRVNPFELKAAEYDAWFDSNLEIYKAELQAVRVHLDNTSYSSHSLEVGAGSGRFGGELGIGIGLDPSQTMLRLAERRGVIPVVGIGESLPFRDKVFSLALTVTTLAFCYEPFLFLKEMFRVLRRGGKAVVAAIDRGSPLGRWYESKKEKSHFYRHARFLCAHEIVDMVKDAGFSNLSFSQTLFGRSLGEASLEVKRGFGQGGFVVVSGVKA